MWPRRRAPTCKSFRRWHQTPYDACVANPLECGPCLPWLAGRLLYVRAGSDVFRPTGKISRRRAAHGGRASWFGVSARGYRVTLLEPAILAGRRHCDGRGYHGELSAGKQLRFAYQEFYVGLIDQPDHGRAVDVRYEPFWRAVF